MPFPSGLLGRFRFPQSSLGVGTRSSRLGSLNRFRHGSPAIFHGRCHLVRSRIIALALIFGAALVSFAATPAKKTHKTATKSTAKKSVAPAKKGKSSKAAKSIKARPVRQTQPTPDRYKEIQQALSDRGYFSGPVDGTWGPDSMEALKRFQRDQNIGDDGKLGSLSLIALGLGPKRAPAGE